MADHALATVSNPSSALTDFTLVVDLSDMPADWWTANDTSDGTRGRVYKGDGTTRLAADWIDFDNTAETGLLRVLWSGTLASTGTQELWIEPPVSGNAAVGATATYGSDNAYDSSWEGYWPFDGDMLDRTSNSADGSVGGGSPGVASGGKLGDKLDLTTGDWVDATISTLSDSQITILGWGKPDSSSGCLVGSGSDYEVLLDNNSGNLRFVLNSFGSNDRVTGSTAINTTGVWQHFGGRYDGSTIEVFLDGSFDGSATPSGSWHSLGAVNIGTVNDQSSDWLWAADADEIQIHSTGRSADWISHEYDQTNDNSTFWGTWSWESTSTSDDLTSSDLTGSAPTLDTPTIGQTHALTGSDLTGAAATLDTPTLGQTHGLTGSELTSSAPVLDSPTLAEGTDNLTSTDLTGGAPVLDTPSLGQTHALSATELTSSAPTLETPSIGQTHALTGTELTGGTPTLDSPTLSETVNTDALTSTDLTGSAPTLDTPTIGQVHALTGVDVLGGVSLDSPTLGQTHALTGTDLTGSVPVLDTPVLIYGAAEGVVTITWAATAPGVAWSGRAPTVTFEGD